MTSYLLLNLAAKFSCITRARISALQHFEFDANDYVMTMSGFSGLEVACWPLVPKFAGSNPAEAIGFFRAKKSSARLPSEGK